MTARTKVKTIEIIDMDELEAILEQAKSSALSEEQHRKLKAAVQTLAFLTSEIEDKRTSIKRLRKLLFGATSEKTKKVLEGLLDDTPEGTDGGAEPGTALAAGGDSAEPEKKPKPKGHGRNGAEAYRGARRTKVRHESLKPGDPCKEKACKGRLSRLKKSAKLLRILGEPPIQAELFEKERLRCNLCGMIFTAKSPEGIGEEKYDATATSMMTILRYGAGLPLNRLAQLQGNLGIPLPASTQWDVANRASPVFSPVYEELIRRAAQGKVLHNDDTRMTILEYLKEDRERRNRGDPPDRTGIFTSGVVSVDDEIQIALFFTGRQHAGENLARVLAERDKELDLAIQMCDALSRNVSAEFASIVCNCMSHARRQYVEVFESFPQECELVLKTLGKVFKNDSTARKRGMTAQERLAFHRKTSKRVMAELRAWMSKQFRERLVEPNSGLGQAITYMQNHWRKLTRFLFVAGAPLENNICERMLKKAICHRKNSLFYKTANGARVGDIYMSLIATCQLAGANPFDYLTELQRHSSEVKASPASWLPWNYERAVGRGVENKDATTSAVREDVVGKCVIRAAEKPDSS